MYRTGLTPEQDRRLQSLLRNESDVAYRRRVRSMLSYLELEPGQTILDCGTGMGFYLKAIAELGAECRLYGIDYEERVLRFAQSQLAPKPVLLARGDIHHLAFAPASFDRVVMSEVLEHLADDGSALREVWRAMKPGAILAMTVPYRHYSAWYDPINRVAEGVWGKPIRSGPFAGIWANHERLYEREQLIAVIEQAGFRIEGLEMLTHYCFPGTQTIVYTLGKALVEHNLLPGFLIKSASRFHGQDNRGSMLNPFNWVLALFEAVDRLNEAPGRLANKQTFVNIAVKARKA